MDEVTKGAWLGRLKRVKPIDQYFLTEKCPFSQKRQLKTGNIKIASGLLLTGAIAFVLFAGGSAERQWKQTEAATTKAEDVSNHGQTASQSGGEGSVGMGGGWGSGQSVHSSYGHAGGGGGNRQYTSSQIVRGTEGGAGSGFGLGLMTTTCLIVFGPLWNKITERNAEKEIAKPDETSVYLGKSIEGEQINVKQQYRTTHTQVIGTTVSGKTESVILPWAIRDLETKAGMLIIDGKSDKAFLEKFYAYVVKSGRKSDFRLFSLAHLEPSSTFNPLVGGSSYEIAERVFSSFTFENEYFKNIQYKLFHAVIRLILHNGKVPSFVLVRRLLTDTALLKVWLDRCDDDDVKYDLVNFLKEPDRERNEKIGGLDSHLSHFATGDLATLFNSNESQIQMDQVLRENLVCYFQLPSMYYPTLAAATGRLALQCFQNAVSKRHLGLESTLALATDRCARFRSSAFTRTISEVWEPARAS